MMSAKEIETLQKRSQKVALVILVIFVLLIGYSFVKLRTIKSEIDSAQTTRNNLLLEVKTLKDQADVLRGEVKALKKTKDELSLVAVKATNKLAEADSSSAQKFVDTTVKTSPSITQNLPIIYIQIYDRRQKTSVDAIAEKLRQQAYIIPGVESRPNKVKATEVFYFRAEDTQEAERIASILQASGVKDSEAKLAPEQFQGTVRPRQFEIWFSEKAFPP